MLIWLSFFLGCFIGVIVDILLLPLRTASGVLKIDRTNPQKDVYRLDVDNIDDLTKKNRLVLIIDKNADLSQE